LTTHRDEQGWAAIRVSAACERLSMSDGGQAPELNRSLQSAKAIPLSSFVRGEGVGGAPHCRHELSIVAMLQGAPSAPVLGVLVEGIAEQWPAENRERISGARRSEGLTDDSGEGRLTVRSA
jgi:hypothetical protein